MSRSFKGKIGVRRVLCQIALATADKVVDDAHTAAMVDQAIDHVAADEAGAAGDDGNRARRAHVAPIRFIVRTL